MHLPQPRDGWRVFAGEVGVIVLGVLLALGAQQFAEAVTMLGRIAEFRKAVHAEMAGDLWYFERDQRSSACELRTLDDLESWLRSTQPGQVVHLSQILRPITYSTDQSTWDNRDSEVFAALPADERLRYASFYDTKANIDRIVRMYLERFRTLRQLEIRSALSDEDRRKYYEEISVARESIGFLKENVAVAVSVTKSLGIELRRPVWVDDAIERFSDRRLATCPRVTDQGPA